MAVPPRVYVDTSVIGGCVDAEFSVWSLKLFAEFRSGLKVPVVSDLTRAELVDAPSVVRAVLDDALEERIENVFLAEEARALADAYLRGNVVAEDSIADAQHIAIASVERVDVLVSWNFRHVVNLGRIRAFNSVNLKLGCPMLEIRSPREVVYEEKV